MLQIHTTQGLDQIEVGLRLAAERHGGTVLAVSHIGQLLPAELRLKGADAIVFTLCFPSLYAPLLRSDIRFAAFLPSRIAACAVAPRPRTRSICGPPSRSGLTATARKWKSWRGPACLTRRGGRLISGRSGLSGGGARPGGDAGQQCSAIRVGHETAS